MTEPLPMLQVAEIVLPHLFRGLARVEDPVDPDLSKAIAYFFDRLPWALLWAGAVPELVEENRKLRSEIAMLRSLL